MGELLPVVLGLREFAVEIGVVMRAFLRGEEVVTARV
jgi:hypothetical protein